MSLVELCDYEWSEGMHVCGLEKDHTEPDHECFCPGLNGWHLQRPVSLDNGDGCTCFLVPEHMWTTHYGAVEPGSQWEPNPWCMVHFPKPEPKPWGWQPKPDPLAYTCECTGCWACPGQQEDCTCDVDWDKVYGHE